MDEEDDELYIEYQIMKGDAKGEDSEDEDDIYKNEAVFFKERPCGVEWNRSCNPDCESCNHQRWLYTSGSSRKEKMEIIARTLKYESDIKYFICMLNEMVNDRLKEKCGRKRNRDIMEFFRKENKEPKMSNKIAQLTKKLKKAVEAIPMPD